ncbi:hypothetical protein XA68_16804 [Ophiocordyceps unilateralis]|uniref:Uncharacterized protein n=1 Tax=Ophiocordyceps unilateralis TaxID=268505 RepID=A0A2A9PJT1_OPHUN|nr:hypothetical protein XA68_16804 [Ophiocordyceps unilateralis]
MASKLGSKMMARLKPRSVKDATRFTSTVPHAMSKTAGQRSPHLPKSSSWLPGETPEQRVVRLRKAHLAARKAQDKPFERFLDSMREFMDAAHKLTVRGLILFSILCAIVSVYSVWDMLRFNRARRREWIEIQKKFENDDLSAARVAYLKGEGTEAQIALVEEANREAKRLGTKLPPLLPPPEQRTHFEEQVKPTLVPREPSMDGKGVFGIFSGLFGGSSTSTSTSNSNSDEAATADSHLESNVAAGSIAQTVEASAKSVWDVEKERQRKGGSLDRLGLDAGASDRSPPSRTKRWWSW